MPPATLCTLWETRSAVAATAPACTLVCSALAAIRPLTSDSSSAVAARPSALRVIASTEVRTLVMASLSAAAIRPTSSRLWTSTSAVRSPFPRADSTADTRASGRTISLARNTDRPIAASEPATRKVTSRATLRL
ncbi:hypothetical protein GCM10010466_38480 [Planomonospora alba]|uniref:Secreted protein n=1 Tax=Planomonospora alba TaxID=161354 RepID=A0ABP6NEX7_9ACTN